MTADYILRDLDLIHDIIDGLNERAEVLGLSATPVDLQEIEHPIHFSQNIVQRMLNKLEALAPYYLDDAAWASDKSAIAYLTLAGIEATVGEMPRLTTQATGYVVDRLVPLTAEFVQWMYEAMQELKTTVKTEWSLTNVRAKFTVGRWDIPSGPILSWQQAYDVAAGLWPATFTDYPDSDDYANDGTSNTIWAREAVEDFNSGGFDNVWRNICGCAYYRGGSRGSPQVTNQCYLIRKQGSFDYRSISTHRPHTAAAYVFNSLFDIQEDSFGSSQGFLNISSFQPFNQQEFQHIQDFSEDTTSNRETKRVDSAGGVPPFSVNVTPVESGVWRGHAAEGWCCRDAALLTTWNFEV